MGKGVNHSLGVLVCDGDGHWPSTEAIDDSEEVVKTIGVGHRDDVDVKVLEPFGWDGKFLDGRDDASLDFGLLTWQAFPGPFANILFQSWPDKFISNGFPCGINAWMSEAMDNIE